MNNNYVIVGVIGLLLLGNIYFGSDNALDSLAEKIKFQGFKVKNIKPSFKNISFDMEIDVRSDLPTQVTIDSFTGFLAVDGKTINEKAADVSFSQPLTLVPGQVGKMTLRVVAPIGGLATRIVDIAGGGLGQINLVGKANIGGRNISFSNPILSIGGGNLALPSRVRIVRA